MFFLVLPCRAYAAGCVMSEFKNKTLTKISVSSDVILLYLGNINYSIIHGSVNVKLCKVEMFYFYFSFSKFLEIIYTNNVDICQ